MIGLSAFLGIIVVGLAAATLLAFPHLVEGVWHLYAAPSVGALALLPFGKRELPAGAHATVPVADGYRGTKNVVAPGFEEGRWLYTLDDETQRLRITVPDARTAYVTVIAKKRGPFAHIERGLATVRIRLVDVGEGRRLDARLIPATLGVPLSIPAYAVAPNLLDGGYGLGTTFVAALLPTVVVGVIWQAVWWGMHSAQIQASTQRAMDHLQKQLVEV